MLNLEFGTEKSGGSTDYQLEWSKDRRKRILVVRSRKLISLQATGSCAMKYQ